jgi:5'-3' exonuclease
MRKKKHYLPLKLLVDGRNFLYKCYNGSKKTDLVYSNTNGVVYFLFNIQKILHYNQNEINHVKKVIFFFDGTASGILKSGLNPEYKKSRHYGSDHIPKENYEDDFKNQERALKAALKEEGFNVVTDNETEADDMIAYYVKQHPNEAIQIISNDSDFYQLLNEDISMIFSGKVTTGHKMFKKNYIFTEKSFLKKYKMHPLNMRMPIRLQ